MASFKRFNFWPPLLVILMVFAVFWGPALVNVMRQPNASVRLPSSYDVAIETPIQQQISQAKTPLLLVEFYQDACRTCQIIAPWLGRLEHTEAFDTCLHTVRINTEKPENQFFLELFNVDTTPSLFIFQPTAMKKTRVELPDSISEPELKPLLQATMNTHLNGGEAPEECGLFLDM